MTPQVEYFADEPTYRRVAEEIERRTGDLIKLTQDLVRFPTESVDLRRSGTKPGSAEAELQSYIADRLRKLDCEVDQWEPDPSTIDGHGLIPDWHHWQGRPMTVGRLASPSKRGRSLIVNGHIDVVPAGDHRAWTSPPYAADVRDGRVYGRGTSDMKGGIASALVAMEALTACGITLAGDVLFEAVTDEEIGGMGTIAAAERGYLADAAVFPEPSGLNVIVATRGILHGSVRFSGRAAHAEVVQPAWEDGGGVNAIHYGVRLGSRILRVNERAASDPTQEHHLLSPPHVELTGFTGGVGISVIPDDCEILVNATYLPSDWNPGTYGQIAKDALRREISEEFADDSWIAAHPPEWTWLLDYPPSELREDDPIVQCAIAAARTSGGEGAPVGLDSGYDGTLLNAFYGISGPSYGPGNHRVIHAVDEWVSIDNLMKASQGLARIMMDWCGVEGDA